jgi:hypothetical protein
MAVVLPLSALQMLTNQVVIPATKINHGDTEPRSLFLSVSVTLWLNYPRQSVKE